MSATPFYVECPDCKGTGLLFRAGEAQPRVCYSCRPLRVVAGGPTREIYLGVLAERGALQQKLHELAQGCQKREQAYGLPYPRSCRSCGLSGRCKFDGL